MTGFGTISVGRVALVEFPATPASSASQPASSGQAPRTLTLAGQESLPAAATTSLAALQAKHADILGLTGAFVPVTFTDKTDLNGYYSVASANADAINWNGETATATWTMSLARAGTDTEVDVESRLTGGIRNNSFSATGSRWHAPPIGHDSYWSGTGSTPSTVVRTGSDGAMTVYLGLPTPCIPRYDCPVGSYLNGRCRFTDTNGFERSGIMFGTTVTGWTLHNGLVRVQPIASSGILSIDAYTGGAWQTKNWDVQLGGVSLGAPKTVSLLRNEPEIIVLRLLWSRSPGRVTADVTLRRGSRFAELYIQAEVAATLKVVRGTTETGASGGGGAYVTANANDGAGNRYIVGSALTNTADTTTLDAFVGVVAAGSGAVAGDLAADLFSQYCSAPAELVQAVRR
jgi:hypothetical protein